jgi:putative serine protease PepD
MWLGVVVALIAGGVVGGAIVATKRSSATPVSATSPDVCSATDVAEKNLPSVVTISATNGRAGGTGSGEVIRSNGYILTNNHVISIACGVPLLSQACDLGSVDTTRAKACWS